MNRCEICKVNNDSSDNSKTGKDKIKSLNLVEKSSRTGSLHFFWNLFSFYQKIKLQFSKF